MKLPAGTDGGTISNPPEEGLIPYLKDFCGAVEVETPAGHGFIIVDNGDPVAAYFRDREGALRGTRALIGMTTGLAGNEEPPRSFTLRKYNPAEFAQSLEVAGNENLMITGPVVTIPASPAETGNIPRYLDEESLKKIAGQPGVIAVSAFFEGFPVQSIGDADFEHVAALAEDLMRAGTKIADEMKIGSLDQLILETNENKFIIAPCGDLYLCVFTTADAQLGLIRVILKNIQQEIAG
jgi:predicted regulator of Ras-like GTPase activity (Roadblock/LC7/MglB family)